MKNCWPEKFEENNKPAAKNLLEEQAKLLSDITGGMVFAEVIEMDERDLTFSSIRNEFNYRFNIIGKFLKGYRFKVMEFSHDITLYPVKFDVDEALGREIMLQSPFVITIDNPDDLETFLAKVLKSDRMKSIVGSILRLSK